MKNKLFILIGGPGCGKGTISANFPNCDHIETGAIFRALPADSDVAKIIAAGELVPDEKLFKVISARIDLGRDTLLDGFPRTRAQAEWMVQNYAEKFDITVLYICVPPDIMAERIRKRASETPGRADDTDDTVIARRLNTFATQTIPAVEYLRTATGVRFVEIDGIPPIDAVLASVRCVIPPPKKI